MHNVQDQRAMPWRRMMVMSGNPAPMMGARVFTTDSEELGTVKEVVGGAFKVDVSMHPDYWLGCAFVASSTATELRLSVAKDRLDNAKVEAPTK